MRAGVVLLAMTLLPACDGEVAAAGGGPSPALVEVAPTETGTLRLERTYLGMVRSRARASLAAGAEGEVLEVTVREGDRVEAGQLLLRVDAALASADLQAAQATRRRAEIEGSQAARDAQRFSRAGPTAVSQTEIERAATEVGALEAAGQNARAEVARARETLDRHRVVAPFAGVIAARHVDPGAWVSAGTSVLELVSDDDVEVLARVEPALLRDVSVGTAATLRRGDAEAAATVLGVVSALDPATRTAQVRLAPDAPSSWLWAGSTVDVHFVLEHDGPGVLVPRDALVDSVAGTRVVVIADGLAHPVSVEVLELATDRARVVGEGLGAGDRVAVRGNDRLRPDQPVQVVDE